MSSLTLEKMVPRVFELDGDNLKILKHLALHGPLNLTQLSKHTSKYALGLDRWAVKKRLQGTSRFMGLMPNEYIIEEETEKYRYNKQEKKYWLTVKGIIASTSVVPLQKNVLVNHFCWRIGKGVKNKKISDLAKQAIESFMTLLIAIHFLQGLQLTKQKSSKFYYLEFLEHIRNVGGIDVTITDKTIDKEFIKLVRNSIAYYSVVDLLTNHGLGSWDYTLSMVDWSETKESSNDEDYSWYSKIWEWPLHLGDPRHHDPGLKSKLVSTNEIRDHVTLDESYSKEIKPEINSILRSVNYTNKWKLKIF